MAEDGSQGGGTDLEAWYREAYAGLESTAEGRIARGYVSRYLRLEGWLSALIKDPRNEELRARVNGMTQAAKEISELHDWLFREWRNKSEVGDLLVARGSSYSEAERMIRHAFSRGKRPDPDSRRLGLLAFDRRTSSRKPWHTIAAETCDCKKTGLDGKPAHDESCINRVKMRAGRVKYLLKKFGL